MYFRAIGNRPFGEMYFRNKKCEHEIVNFNDILIIEVSYYLAAKFSSWNNGGGVFYGIKSAINFIAAPKDILRKKNHFTSVCYRPDGTFEIYNNQFNERKHPDIDTFFTPAILIT